MALPSPPSRKGSKALSGRRSARTLGTRRSKAMNTMSHKGYIARVEYDERDNIFVGRILGIRSIISFHGETVGELRPEFEHAVRDYLAACKKSGVHPEKPAFDENVHARNTP